ncbi:hypothetical protein A2U01_0031546, partial [Trifolium medium]|nr:hypothetical protein [Trifolium medium]
GVAFGEVAWMNCVLRREENRFWGLACARRRLPCPRRNAGTSLVVLQLGVAPCVDWPAPSWRRCADIYVFCCVLQPLERES